MFKALKVTSPFYASLFVIPNAFVLQEEGFKSVPCF